MPDAPRFDPVPFDLNAFLPYRVTVLAEQLSRDFSRQYRDRFGISTPEWRVVAHLSQSHDGSVSVREIHRRVHMDKSKISRAAARLEGAGFLTKRPDAMDRRLVCLRLTGKGQAMMAELAQLADAHQARLIAALTEDAEGFLNGVARLTDATRDAPDRPDDGN